MPFNTLKALEYPGRGLIVGRSEDGKNAVVAYYMMGRSEQSFNRMLIEEGNGIRTEALRPDDVDETAFAVHRYSPVRCIGSKIILSNGNHTENIYEALLNGETFASALRECSYKTDAPHFTARISALVDLEDYFTYKIGIVKRGRHESCERFFFEYDYPEKGYGHMIHTYMSEGNPLPSYKGEPERVHIIGDIDRFTADLWESLNDKFKISLFVRFIDIENGFYDTRIINNPALGDDI